MFGMLTKVLRSWLKRLLFTLSDRFDPILSIIPLGLIWKNTSLGKESPPMSFLTIPVWGPETSAAIIVLSYTATETNALHQAISANSFEPPSHALA